MGRQGSGGTCSEGWLRVRRESGGSGHTGEAAEGCLIPTCQQYY